MCICFIHDDEGIIGMIPNLGKWLGPPLEFTAVVIRLASEPPEMVLVGAKNYAPGGKGSQTVT